jgi:hypothetical protein
MARRSAKTPVVCLTREHKIYRFLSRKGIRTVEKMESVEAPVETIESEVFGKPIFELVFALGGVSSEGTTGGEDERCPGFEYTSHVARLRVGVRPGGHFLQHGQVLIRETFFKKFGSREVLGRKMEMSDEVAFGIVPQFRERIGIFISLIQLGGLHKVSRHRNPHKCDTA